MKNLSFIAAIFFASTFSSAGYGGVLKLETCNVESYGADVTNISSVPKGIVREILLAKGYTFDSTSDEASGGLTIYLYNDFGETNSQELPPSEEPGALEIIGYIALGTVSLISPAIYTEEMGILHNGSQVYGRERTRVTYLYGYDSLEKRSIKSLKALPDCVLK